jgi:hypothetical protein
MLGITFFSFGGDSVHSVTKGGFGNIVNLSSTSAGHFFSCMDSLNGKDDSGFLGLYRHDVVVVWWSNWLWRLYYAEKCAGGWYA